MIIEEIMVVLGAFCCPMGIVWIIRDFAKRGFFLKAFITFFPLLMLSIAVFIGVLLKIVQ